MHPGIDSLAAVELSTAIKTKCNVHLTLAQLFAMTVQQVRQPYAGKIVSIYVNIFLTFIPNFRYLQPNPHSFTSLFISIAAMQVNDLLQISESEVVDAGARGLRDAMSGAATPILTSRAVEFDWEKEINDLCDLVHSVAPYHTGSPSIPIISPTTTSTTTSTNTSTIATTTATGTASTDSVVSADEAVQVSIGPASSEPTPVHILLTGATGFLGPVLLCRLLRKLAGGGANGPSLDCSSGECSSGECSSGECSSVVPQLSQLKFRISCIVRGSDGRDRVLRAVEECGDLGDITAPGVSEWKHELLSRVQCYEGDVSLPSFGLHPAVYHHLLSTVTAVVHNAAQVSHILPYAALRPTNVLGTAHVAQFCR